MEPLGRVALIAATAALVAGCGSSSPRRAVALRLPVIHERFTLQPCPHRAKTTVAIEGCLEHKVLRTDRRVHGFELGALQLLKSGHRQDFIRGERAWYAYREGICSAEASRWAGGTVHSVVFASCVLAENRAHLKPLGLLNGTVEPGDGP